MNKYQEALSRIERYNYWHNTERVYNNLEPHFNILQELVDKTTPMKVKYKDYSWECGRCGVGYSETSQNNYCPHCGQATDWREN